MTDERTRDGDRRYDLSRLGAVPQDQNTFDPKTVVYARVSGRGRAEDLTWQKQVRELYCGRQG